MNIEDFDKDLDKLSQFYLTHIQSDRLFYERMDYLKKWLAVRKYNDAEKKFLIFNLKLRIAIKIGKDAIIYENHEDLQDYLPENEWDHPDDTYSIIELMNDLNKRFNKGEKLKLFKSIDKNILINTIRKSYLDKAESWAINNNFISHNGKWVSGGGRLGTFLNILVEQKIIIENRKRIDEYFSTRYSCDQVGNDLMKPSKSKVHNKEFIGLVVELTKSEQDIA